MVAQISATLSTETKINDNNVNVFIIKKISIFTPSGSTVVGGILSLNALKGYEV
jgi:hypothetical protein